MTRDNRKLAIPAILAATVLVAGLFAFAPVEQASTVHVDIVQSVVGVQTTITETIEATVNNEFQYHQAILTATEAFTLSEITIESDASDTSDTCDTVGVGLIGGYPQEYGTGDSAARNAFLDGRSGNFFGNNYFTILQVNDDVVPSTWSMNSERADASGSSLIFGPNSNVFVELELFDNACGNFSNDFTIDVTFHLNGIAETDVDTSQVNDVGDIDE